MLIQVNGRQAPGRLSTQAGRDAWLSPSNVMGGLNTLQKYNGLPATGTLSGQTEVYPRPSLDATICAGVQQLFGIVNTAAGINAVISGQYYSWRTD